MSGALVGVGGSDFIGHSVVATRAIIIIITIICITITILLLLLLLIIIIRLKLALTSGASFARWGLPLAPPPTSPGDSGKGRERATDPNHIP